MLQENSRSAHHWMPVLFLQNGVALQSKSYSSGKKAVRVWRSLVSTTCSDYVSELHRLIEVEALSWPYHSVINQVAMCNMILGLWEVFFCCCSNSVLEIDSVLMVSYMSGVTGLHFWVAFTALWQYISSSNLYLVFIFF